jgi:hypothetical protein
MTKFLDKLNLRPGERRLVVFGGLAVFIVLNIWLVWPQFGQVSVWNNQRITAEQTLAKYNQEIARRPFYEKTLAALQVLGGQIPPDEQALQMQRDVISLAALAGVQMPSSSTPQRQQSGGGRGTNAFFEEQIMQISVVTGERELVDFLYNLGKRNSMIRARTMNLQPDQTRMRLNGQITLVASYQKKAPARTVTAATGASKPSPATKPATTSTKTNVPPKTGAPPPKTNAPPLKPTTTSTQKTNPPQGKPIMPVSVKPTPAPTGASNVVAGKKASK